MSVEYVHVGSHADILTSGRTLGPGDRVPEAEITEDGAITPHAQHLIDEGVLVDVASFGGHANEPTGTGEDLQARARELNVKGRSTMTADELRAAVSTAETKEATDAA